MIRTGYSFRTAVGHVKDVVARVKEIGWEVAPIADRCSTFGFVDWTAAAKEAGLRPAYGVELAVVSDLGDKRPSPDYWQFIAVRELRPLHDLIYLATSNPGKEPSITYEQAVDADGLIRISGERVQLARTSGSFLFGVSGATPKGLVAQAREMGLKFVARQDNYYPREEDKEFYRVCSTRAGTQTYPQHVLSDHEWAKSVSWKLSQSEMKDALELRDELLGGCVAELTRAEVLTPAKPMTLRQMCEIGAKKLGVDLADRVYADRLDRELAMIAEKNFEDYFYILADLIAWAKERMVVGPARGSSCGSLMCYLLGITAVDPIPYGLMFERFVDVTRSDLPDVDVDFSDARRQLVFDYAAEKFGAGHVARLGTTGTYQAKSALNRVAVALRIPSWRMDKVASSVIRRAMGDSRASQTIEDTLKSTQVGQELVSEFPEVKIVERLEDHPANAGVHAAGVVITKRPVLDHVAVDARTMSVMADKKDAEKLDLLKIDALGLTQLSVFERTLELIGVASKSGWLERLPLDDRAAFDVLNKQHFAGVFQFVGSAVRSLSRALLRRATFDSLEDIVAITALARPGPMGGGSSDKWNERRTGLKPVEYWHPLFEPYLRDTYGVVVYQEQVMAICRELGDLTWEEVNALRRAMSKSLGLEFFNQYGEKFKANAAARGIDKGHLETIWRDLCNFGGMAFNRSHSVAYGIVSYYCCWLKAHHPVEFAAATLDAQTDPADQIATLRELASEGIDYLPFSLEESTDKWEIGDRDGKKILVGPLTVIDGIGPATVMEVVDARKRGIEIRPAIAKRLAGAETQIDSLYPIRVAIERLVGGMDQISATGMASTPIRDIMERGGEIRGEVLVAGVLVKLDQTNENALIRVQKRGGDRVKGPEESLHMYLRDDTGEFFCKVHRLNFEDIGKEISERGKAGKAIYAFRGNIFNNDNFSMMWVKKVKYLGDLREKKKVEPDHK